MTTVSSFLSQPWPRLVVICSLPVFVFPLLSYLAVAPFGSQVFLWFVLVLPLFMIAGLLGLLSVPVLCFVRRLRPLVARTLVASALVVAATILGIPWGHRIRMAAFDSLAERSAPLVQAIRAYEAKHGQPPSDLSKLVPDFLPGIPSTGMAAYPRYDYHVGDKAARYDENPWVLVVFTPNGGINFDRFMCFPRQNYPSQGYGGGLQRIRDWAYVHE